jgi:hypothetical protein
VPEKEIAARGGAVRVRTQKLSGGRYRKIYVVRKAGPRGGHTVAGEVEHQRSTRADHPSHKVKADSQPDYRIKPRSPKKEVERARRR